MSKHASYQLNNSLPYFFQRFDKNAVLKPLYDFDEIEGRYHYTDDKRELAEDKRDLA
jgi:hypothetical protein